jgi:hypothetical protein
MSTADQMAELIVRGALLSLVQIAGWLAVREVSRRTGLSALRALKVLPSYLTP